MAGVPTTAVAAAAPIHATHVPDSFQQVLKLTRYQLREYLSSRRFVVLIGIIVAIGVIITSVVAYFRGSLAVQGLLSSPLNFYGSFWGGAASFVIVLAAVFFGGDAIAGEFQNKTGYFLMGLPIRRATVYIGKYIAAYIASVCVLLIYLVLVLANGAYYFGDNLLPWQLLPSFVLALVYLAAVLGGTFMFSSLFKTSAYGFVLTAILFLFGFSLVETLVTALVKMEPWMVISYASGAIGEVFASSINWGIAGTILTITTPIGPGRSVVSTVYTPGVLEGVVIMLVYFLGTVLLGLWLFEREEFT
jgi:ABC-2 type transport system permease protein